MEGNEGRTCPNCGRLHDDCSLSKAQKMEYTLTQIDSFLKVLDDDLIRVAHPTILNAIRAKRRDILYALKEAPWERDDTTRKGNALAFVKDVAEHGLRCDLNPTISMSGDQNKVYEQLSNYLSRVDAQMRENAKAVLMG
jgi:hypothetical protein